jgi:hypothetical protein
MKHLKFSIRGMAGCVLLAGMCISAQAENFDVTNAIYNSEIVSWPTNAVGTNGLGQLTGGAIGVANYRQAGLEIQGLWLGTTGYSNQSGSGLRLVLVRSAKDSPPGIGVNTNWATAYNDWETSQWLDLLMPFVNTNVPTSLITNLSETWLSPANWIGVYMASNGTQCTMITNPVVTLNKKVIPMRLQ